MAGAFETGKYRNVFAEYGYPEAEIQRRVEQTFETIFYGNEEERFYHEAGADMAYIEDRRETMMCAQRECPME